MHWRIQLLRCTFWYCVSFLAFKNAYTQTGGLNGVYAGIEVSLPTVMGQGMDRTDRVILFRPDGTFNVNLRKADWQTAVTGRYSMAGDKVTLQFSSGAKEEMTMEKDGDLRASGNTGSYGMLRMATFNSVPPGFYKFSNVSSTGGGASGQVFVGSSSSVGLYFDGKGNFSRQASGATMVVGNDVGGGTSHKDVESGSYNIQNGVLHLRYGNGKTETHSFFCRPTEKPLMAAINGRIYFMEEPAAAAVKPAGTKATPTASKATPANAPLNALEELYKANKAQGGTTLDRLQGIKASATVNGMTVVSRVDLTAPKIRIEWWKGTALVGIEQVSGEQGWQWQQGKRTALAPARLKEMKDGLYSGILGLRRQVIDRLQGTTVKRLPDNTIAVSGRLDGQEHIFVVNDQGQLTGEATGTGTASIFSNLKNVQGILLPFTEKLTINGQTVQIQYTAYEINPLFAATDWQEK